MTLQDYGEPKDAYDFTVKGIPSPVPGLLITRTFDPRGRRTHPGWRITHQRTLRAVTWTPLPRVATARAAALLLGHVTDWTQDQTTVQNAVKAQGGPAVIKRILSVVLGESC